MPQENVEANDRIQLAGSSAARRSRSLFKFRRGMVVRQEDFGEREQALESVGLSE